MRCYNIVIDKGGNTVDLAQTATAAVLADLSGGPTGAAEPAVR